MPVIARQFTIDDVLQDQISRSDCGWVDLVQWTQTGTQVAALAQAVDSSLTFTTGGDAAQSGDSVPNNGQSWLQTTVSVATSGTVSFWWKVSSQANCDWLEFYIDGTRQDRISGTVDWQPKSYTISTAGSHTLKWRYVKDASGSSGSDCGWVDAVQWISPEQPPSVISYVYDPSGRRIEKRYDGLTQMKYIYDGDHIIAEYDGFTNLLHKYIYDPGVDQPICMIDVPNSNATYYYHFDGLGSVVALTNSSGSTVEVYEYSVYGQAGASDASHPNRFMFTGREFDKDTGLYYYRARYYNPYIGRFLQTDPIGYGDGMNWYAYCRNDPINAVDVLGTTLIKATGRAAISQGCESDICLTGSTSMADWAQLMRSGGEVWDKAAEVKGYLYDAVMEVAIHAFPELISYEAGGIVSAAISAVTGATTSLRAQWRAFIEVRDYNDSNANGKVDPDDWESHGMTEEDLWGKPHWVELKGVYPIGTRKVQNGGAGSHWEDGGGYDSASAAFGACQKAMQLLAKPADPKKVFAGWWYSRNYSEPLVAVNDAIAVQLLAADMTDAFLQGLGALQVVKP